MQWSIENLWEEMTSSFMEHSSSIVFSNKAACKIAEFIAAHMLALWPIMIIGSKVWLAFCRCDVVFWFGEPQKY